MIKLFVTDLDGCISTPFQSPDWDSVSKLRAYNSKVDLGSGIPITICTGRPFPYAEAVAQWLGVRLPFLFESGGGMYQFEGNILQFHPSFDENIRSQIKELKAWMDKAIISKTEGMIPEFAKFTDAGLIHPNAEVIRAVLPEIIEHVTANFSSFEVHFTDVSINVFSKNTNKGRGIEWLCQNLGLLPGEIAYIGDSGGDIPALSIAGMSFAPANANSTVKQVAEVLPSETTKAVLQAYELVLSRTKGAQEFFPG